jgi:transposase
MARRFVGIDLAKRTMEVCVLEGGKIERRSFRTDVKGRQMLARMLRKTDKVGVEMCCCSALLTRELEAAAGCRVYNLNAGELRIIWKSRKKTDKEDSLKLAKYVRDTPEEEMKTVGLPGEEEEAFRADISEREFLKKERTAAVNRLHSLYARSGIIDVKKKDLKSAARRGARRAELPERLMGQARTLEEQLEMFERQLGEAEEKVNGRTRKHELAPYVMSIPGVGIGIAGVLLAYLGDGSRFEKAGQVANYAGLVPSVDCSGETERYGGIAKRAYCKPIRSVVIEGVWSIARMKDGAGGPLRERLLRLSGRMSRKKSAVAVARKTVCLAWLLMKRREFYNGAKACAIKSKMEKYKVNPEGWEALLSKMPD